MNVEFARQLSIRDASAFTFCRARLTNQSAAHHRIGCLHGNVNVSGVARQIQAVAEFPDESLLYAGCLQILQCGYDRNQAERAQQRLYFFPLPQGHGSFRPGLPDCDAAASRMRTHSITFAGARCWRSCAAINCIYGSMWVKNFLYPAQR